MTIGLPIVGLATTELPSIITNGVDGIIDTSLDRLIDAGMQLLADPGMARQIGAAGRRTALERFGIDRFVHDWRTVFAEVTGSRVSNARGT